MTKASDNAFPSILITEGTEPAAPAAGKQRLYIDSTSHHLKRTDSSGTDVDLESGAGLGAWTAYTPTLTASVANPTLGSTVVSGRYKLLDSKTGCVVIRTLIDTTGWNPGSGTYRWSLPAGWTTGALPQLGHALIIDAGTRYYLGMVLIAAGDTKVQEIQYQRDSTGAGTVQHNTPVTWATGDELQIVIPILELA